MVIFGCDSIQGRSHRANDTVCQDASYQGCIVGNWIVSASADGVGSCEFSDVGSRIAVETAVEVCQKYFPIDGDDGAIIALLRTAFNAALSCIYRRSIDDGKKFEEYDTTLDVVIFNGSRKVYYGHSGDGGIFTLSANGDYMEITSVQEGEESNSVVPLRGGNKVWEFGIKEGEFAVVASFTDGIRDKLSPEKLKNQKYKVKVPLANFFMYFDVCGCEEEEATEIMTARFSDFRKYFDSNQCNINDDATIALIINTDVYIEEPKYEKPDKVDILFESIEGNYGHLSSKKRRKIMNIELSKMQSDEMGDMEISEVLEKYYPSDEIVNPSSLDEKATKEEKMMTSIQSNLEEKNAIEGKKLDDIEEMKKLDGIQIPSFNKKDTTVGIDDGELDSLSLRGTDGIKNQNEGDVLPPSEKTQFEGYGDSDKGALCEREDWSEEDSQQEQESSSKQEKEKIDDMDTLNDVCIEGNIFNDMLDDDSVDKG